MLSIIFVAFAVIVHVFGSDCDKLGVLVYEDIGCKPIGSDTCPTKFNCSGLEPTQNKCNFKGKLYDGGELVDNDLATLSCQIQCHCTEKRSFTCAILDCPEWLGVPIPPKCYRKYELNSCCSSGHQCEPFDEVPTCEYGEKTYLEGQKFYPENSCLTCVCQKGFTGELTQPFCRRLDCGSQLRHNTKITNGCVPFYARKEGENLCCPAHWMCPEGREKVLGEAKSEDSCTFGRKEFKVGQRFEIANVTDLYGSRFDIVACECVVPPLLRCLVAK